MATFAARRLGDMNTNTAHILGIEMLAASEGIEFHRPLTSSPALEAAMASIRGKVLRFEQDRFFAPALAEAKNLVAARAFEQLLPADVTMPSSAS
jgi:histidine ammonia-lyase